MASAPDLRRDLAQCRHRALVHGLAGAFLQLGRDLVDEEAHVLVVVVQGVEKPGNLGAVLRSADGAGAHAVIAADPLTDPFNPNAIRASLGTIFAMPVVSAPSSVVLDWLARRGIRPVTATVGAEISYGDADLTGPLAIALGMVLLVGIYLTGFSNLFR